MKKILLGLITVFSTFYSYAQPQISNYSFEDWSNRYGKTAPTGWKCDSVSINNNSLKRVNSGSHGNSSLQINTVTYQAEVVSAYIERYDSISSTPGDLLFDYKVINNNSTLNGLYIEIYFLDAKKNALRDFQWSSSGNNTDFAAGTMPISFKSNEIPKYYTLRISYFFITALAGEYIIIDNLRFLKGTGNVKNTVNSMISVYPNPAIGSLNFTDNAADKLTKVRLISTTGQNVEFPVTNSSIDISSLSKGIYVAELLDSDNQILKREKVSILN
jgi:hypothetical protein